MATVMEASATPPEPSGPIRVLLVDAQNLVTSSLRTVLELSEGIVVVGEATTERHCIDRVLSTRPDVVVTDVYLREGSGIEAIRRISSFALGTRVLVLTTDDDDETLLAATRAGASGYLLKRSRSNEVVRGIHLTALGTSVLDPRIAAGLLDGRASHSLDPFDRLTAREQLVLASVAAGNTNLEIAKELHFSERTIKNVVSCAMGKIGARRRSEAAALFVRHAGRDPFGVSELVSP
jgi:DNA-binding NarL/FixJ family response regulator